VKPSATTQRCLFYGGIAIFLLSGYLYATVMPGHSHEGPLPPASASASAVEAELKAHVSRLALAIGERNVGEGDSLARARDYVAAELRESASQVADQVRFESLGADGSSAENVILEHRGRSAEVVLVGAHYDSAPGTPGANDNASGVAIGLYLAKRLSVERLRRTLRWVFFANEEPPYFQNVGMGSLAHARGCAERKDPVVAMLALESLGFYSEAPGSQRYPWPVGLFYPDRGDFVGFVGNIGSRSLVRSAIGVFRSRAAFPSEGTALPGWVPGVGWSDHWAFWQFGYPAIMITDTAVYRDPSYHRASDLPPNLSYERMARVAAGLYEVVVALVERD
jgi:peptidase M28-like protein